MMKQVYLAGGKSQGWRRKVTAMWRRRAASRDDDGPSDLYVFTHDPFTDSRQDAPYQFVNDDLEAIRSCDLVFAVVDYHVYTGLTAEVGFAHALGIPVLLVWDVTSEKCPPRVEMFTASMCAAVFTDVATAARFAWDRYLTRR